MGLHYYSDIKYSADRPMSILFASSCELVAHRVPEALVKLGMGVYPKHSDHYAFHVSYISV